MKAIMNQTLKQLNDQIMIYQDIFNEMIQQILSEVKNNIQVISENILMIRDDMNNTYIYIESKRKEAKVLKKIIDDNQFNIKKYECQFNLLKYHSNNQYQNELDKIKLIIDHSKQNIYNAQKKLSIVNMYIDVYMEKFTELDQKFSHSVNQVLFLSLLEKRLNILTDVTSHVLDLLNKEPDDIYFNNEYLKNE